MGPEEWGRLTGMALGFPLWSAILFLGPCWIINSVAGRKVANGYSASYVFSMIFGGISMFGGCVSMITPEPNPALSLSGSVGYAWALWCKAKSQDFNAERAQAQKAAGRQAAAAYHSPSAKAPAYPGFSAQPPAAPQYGSPPTRTAPEPTSGFPAMQLASAFVALSIAVVLMGGLWLATEDLRADYFSASKASGAAQAASSLASADDYWNEAKTAAKKGEYTTATVRAQMALNSLKKEGRPAQDIQSCKALIAISAYKSQDYKLALEHYVGLHKSSPKAGHQKTIAAIRQKVWAEQVKPLLSEAEKEFAKGDYGRARRPTEAAMTVAKEHGLNTTAILSLQSRIRSAEGAGAIASSGRRREAYLNEVITVRLYPYGGSQRMTRREYLARKARGD